MLSTYPTASLSAPMIPPIKGASVKDLVHAIAWEMGIPSDAVKFNVIGVRPGEKIHESLSPTLHSDDGPQFSPEELRALVRFSIMPRVAA